MRKKKSNITTFAVLTTLAILTWVLVEAYLLFNKRNFESVPEGVLAPLSPTLDTEVLDRIEKRRFFAQEEVPSSVLGESTNSAVAR